MTDRRARLAALLEQLAKEMDAVAITARMPPSPFDRDEVGRRCAEWATGVEAVRTALLREPPETEEPRAISAASDWIPKRYLGDGVYAAVERGMVKLTTEDGVEVSNVVFLEPEVVEALKLFYTDAIQAARAAAPKGK